MWLITNLTHMGSTCKTFYFHNIRVTPLRIAFLQYQLTMKKYPFFYCSRHERSRHIVYGQDTWYMYIFYQATLCIVVFF